MTQSTAEKRIAIGADHGGFPLKEKLKRFLVDRGYVIDDCGTYDAAACDYPTFAGAVASRVSEGSAWRGIVIDGAGIGSCMTANKFPRVRAAMCYDLSSAANSREHNNANVLTLGAGLIGASLAEQIVELWLAKDCTVDRHLKRVAIIDEIERRVLGGDRPVPSKAAAHPADSAQTQHEHDSGRADAKPRAAPIENTMNKASGDSLLPAELSNADFERIAERIVQIMGGTLRATCRCASCGPTCCEHCAVKDPAAVRELIAHGASRIGHGLGGGRVDKEVAKFIDHTLLKPEATRQQIDQLCREAAEYGFASVCVNPTYVKQCASLLKGTSVKVCTVIGFPLGTHVADIKSLETRRAIRDGAREIDMVINIGALKSGDDELVFQDIKAVTDACIDGRAICKVIIECALLTDNEKVRACLAAKRARAEFVKTSTGFATGGATARDVALMAEVVRGTRMSVKAAGGIRNFEDLKAMIAAGASRIGASAGVAIVQAAKGLTVSGSDAAPAKSGAGAEKY
ncbi:MAG: deoxyribose-phosphate aldolase [Phycisphaerae bacterium]|nr:deoxyribose-phosphate aldolase [Phycisphaerae bacterium]